MIAASWLHNASLADGGRIDAFGTVRLVHNAAGSREQKTDELRVHHHLLHKYADGEHHAVIVGAQLSVRDESDTGVATISHKYLVPTDEELRGEVDSHGFVIDPKCDRGSVADDLDKVMAGQCPTNFDETPRARVDWKLNRVVVFWIEDDFPLVFTTDGKAVPATVEYPLSRKRWQ
jgi:hypothetical protein